jgi:nicotinamidase/pyrazinamidase
VQGTAGAELTAGLERSRIARIFPKGTDRGIDSYSGFFDNGHTKSTGLGEFLKASGVKEVAVCGLATDYCVKFTVLDALQLRFNTSVIREACRGVDIQPGDSERAFAEMAAAGALIQ